MAPSGRETLSAVFGGLGLATAVLGVTLLINAPVSAPAFDTDTSEHPTDSCLGSPVFRILPADAAIVRTEDGGYQMKGDGWIQTLVCEPGLLNIEASPETSRTQPPTLQVQLDQTVLYSAALTTRRTLSLRIERPGIISVNYLDDTAAMTRRNVTIRGLRMLDANCNSVNVTILGDSGGWYPETGTLSFYLAAGASLTPCAHGTMTLSVLGQQANGAFPELRISQGGHVLTTLIAEASAKQLSLPVSDQEVIVTIKNPYFATLYDRDINIHSATFRPDDF